MMKTTIARRQLSRKARYCDEDQGTEVKSRILQQDQGTAMKIRGLQ